MKNLNHQEKTVPQGVNHYIQTHFQDDFLTDIRPVEDAHGTCFWYVDITHNGSVYHLRFSHDGFLIDKDIETISYPGEEVDEGEGD